MYKYGGARAMVELHELEMRKFLAEWQNAQGRGLDLPESEDPDYASYELILRHVLRAARGYMRWICKSLDLPDPGIDDPPETARVASGAEEYLNHLLEKWRLPLAEVEEERFFRPGHPTSWGLDVCLESMLEHAIVHPMRHRHQLARLGQTID